MKTIKKKKKKKKIFFEKLIWFTFYLFEDGTNNPSFQRIPSNLSLFPVLILIVCRVQLNNLQLSLSVYISIFNKEKLFFLLKFF